MIDYFAADSTDLRDEIRRVIKALNDSKEYGSIIKAIDANYTLLYKRAEEIIKEGTLFSTSVENDLLPLIKTAEAISQKYDVVITNPPYLGSSRFSPKLDAYVKDNYADVKSDLSMVMYKKALEDFSKKDGYVAFITTTSWMFLTSFEKLRKYMLASYDFESIVEFGTELFEGKVGHNPIVAWVVRKTNTNKNIKK